MTNIQYTNKDIFLEENLWKDNILIHIVNDAGIWGAGFAKRLHELYPFTKAKYIAWFKDRDREDGNFGLGECLFLVNSKNKNTHIGNLVAQKGVKSPINPNPIRYLALRKTLVKVREYAQQNNLNIIMPQIGSSLAGGTWVEVERLIEEELCHYDLKVKIYVI